MNATVVAHTDELGRAAWLELRRHGIGGSDAAAIAGMSRWASPLSLWMEKTGQVVDDTDTEPMRWGRLLEDVIAQAFTETTGLDVRHEPRLLAHPEHSFMLANIDRLVFESAASTDPLGVLECKNVSNFKTAEWADGAVPDYYQLQGQHYLAVTGLERIWYCALIGGNQLAVAEMERDESLIGELIEMEQRFWRRCVDRSPPPADGSDATTEALKTRYATPDPDSVVDLDPMVLGWIADRAAAKARRDSADLAITTVDNQLKQLLGDHEIGMVDGQPAVTWKPQSRAEHVVKASTFRKLSFPKPKGPPA